MLDLRASTLLPVLLATSVLAQDHTSEQSEAQINDPTLECTPYSYLPSAKYAHTLPPIWQTASILPNDAAAMAMWNNISGTIPTNIQPKGQLNGSTIGVNYDGAHDPDCWWTVTKCTTPKFPGLPADVASVPEPQTMGYGFDDGPNCSHNAFYDYLASVNQKATMYYIGSNVMDWPLEAQRALADGHEICAHTWSHRYMTAFSSQDAFAELWYSMQAIKLVTGVTPTCWRPPYGDVDDRIRAIAHALGLQTITWGYDSNDWRVGSNNVTTATVDASYTAFINNETTGEFNTIGAILLTHELNNYTMQAAINNYPRLKAAFRNMVPVGVALNKTQPYQEANYSLPTFEQYISGQRTVTSNSSAPGTSTASGSGISSPSSSSRSVSGKVKSSASTTAASNGSMWTLLSVTMTILAGLAL